MRASSNIGEATSLRADGVVLLRQFPTNTTPSAPFKGSCRNILLMSRPPLLSCTAVQIRQKQT